MIGTVEKKVKKKVKKAAKKAKKKAKKKAAKNGTGNGADPGSKALAILPPNFQWIEVPIVGTTVYVQHKWSEKARKAMRDAQAAGSSAKRKGGKRAPKDFNALYKDAMHRTTDGGYGIPAGAFFKALVSACRLCEFKMTIARQALYIQADAESADPGDRGGLVRITKGKPSQFETAVRIQQTTDIRVRPLWEPGWKATVRVRFDADILSMADIANLFMRAGMQVGVGEGRPDTPSGGMGWGLFEVLTPQAASA